jgi:hypothetical protein
MSHVERRAELAGFDAVMEGVRNTMLDPKDHPLLARTDPSWQDMHQTEVSMTEGRGVRQHYK